VPRTDCQTRLNAKPADRISETNAMSRQFFSLDPCRTDTFVPDLCGLLIGVSGRGRAAVADRWSSKHRLLPLSEIDGGARAPVIAGAETACAAAEVP